MCVKTQIRTSSVARKEPITYVEFHGNRLTITKRDKEEQYIVSEFQPGAGWEGRAFRLQKDCETHYNVFVCRRGQNHLCDCQGFEACGNCKHHDAVRHLLWEGELDNVNDVDENGQPIADLAQNAGVEAPY